MGNDGRHGKKKCSDKDSGENLHARVKGPVRHLPIMEFVSAARPCRSVHVSAVVAVNTVFIVLVRADS